MNNPIFILVLSLVFLEPVIAQENINPLEFWKFYSDSENAMYKTSCELAFNQLEQREQQIAGLSSREDYLARQQLVRMKLNNLTGEFPEKTPLNARVTGVIKEKDYRVEKIVFESLPGYYVTAALFLPAKRKGKLPVIIYASGHTANGFRSETYQHILINLVKKGFAVFAFDPVGQGERWQYFDESGEKRFNGTTIEHSYPGAQCYISGYSPTKFFVWDGIRSVDYLLTRKEIDAERIGMTGRSGGGTQTAYTAAMDDRILAAAPECFITKMEYVLKSIGPQDAEQNLYHMISEGLDHADLLEVRAPKPSLMITTTRDFFSIQGARETFDEVKRFYAGLGAADDVYMVEDDDGHASTRKNREAMYAFFQKYLNNPGSPEDLDVEILEESELWVTESGSVTKSLESKNLFDLNQVEVAGQVEQLALSRNDRSALKSVTDAARKLSGFEYPQDEQPAVFSGRTRLEDYHLETYLVPGSGDYQLPVALYKPIDNQQQQVVMIFDEGGMEQSASGSTIKQLIAQGYAVLIADLPGIGSLGPGYLKGDAYVDNTSFNQWFAGILTAKSIVGLRAEDMVRLVQFIGSEVGRDHTVTAISVGALGSELLHAAAFEQNISRIGLINPFLSYAEIALSVEYKPAFITSVVAGAINQYDLPDLMAAVSPRELLVVNSLNPLGAAYQHRESSGLLKYPADFYQSQSVAANFQLVKVAGEAQVITKLLEWLE